MVNLKVNVLTNPGMGGPLYWARNLALMLTKEEIDSYHIYKLRDLIQVPFYQKANIIHTTIPLTYRLWKKPVVLTLHGEYPIEKKIWRYFYPLTIKKADVVTIPSHFLKERLNLDNAIVIPNAIFPNQFKQVKHKESNDINLVTVTNFSFKDKAESVLNLIEIYGQIKKNIDKKINYTLVGGGTYLEKIKEKLRKDDTNIRFTGFLNDPRKILEESDIFLYYSSHDNFPIAILEAMASGLPVITNNVGAVHEIIENRKDGYVAETYINYQEFLLNLVNDPKLREKIGNNARKSVEKKFDWNNIIHKYIKIYKNLYFE